MKKLAGQKQNISGVDCLCFYYANELIGLCRVV